VTGFEIADLAVIISNVNKLLDEQAKMVNSTMIRREEMMESIKTM